MENFEIIRKQKKLTQTEVANHLQITQATLSSYENGRTQPDFKTLIALADYYDVSVDYLLGRTNKRDVVIPEERKQAVQQLLELPESMFIYISGQIKAYYDVSKMQ